MITIESWLPLGGLGLTQRRGAAEVAEKEDEGILARYQPNLRNKSPLFSACSASQRLCVRPNPSKGTEERHYD